MGVLREEGIFFFPMNRLSDNEQLTWLPWEEAKCLFLFLLLSTFFFLSYLAAQYATLI